jgi:Rrf2 family protein
MEYALRATVFLAAQNGKPCVNHEIAAAMQVPVGYMAKVLQNLRRAGIVNSQRGFRGGFVLSRPAQKISILDVVKAVDAIPRITSCPLGLKEHRNELCPLHRQLDDAAAAIEKIFAENSIDDMVVKDDGNSDPMKKVDVFARMLPNQTCQSGLG